MIGVHWHISECSHSVPVYTDTASAKSDRLLILTAHFLVRYQR